MLAKITDFPANETEIACGKQFAALVKECGYDLSRLEECGRLLGDLQQQRQPPRDFAYSGAVLRGWLSGKLVPSKNECNVLRAMGGTKDAWETFDHARTAALATRDYGKNYHGEWHTEFQHLLRRGYDKSRMSPGDVVRKLLADYGIGSSKSMVDGKPAKPLDQQLVNTWMTARNRPSFEVMAALGDMWASNMPAAAGLPHAYDDLLKQRAEEIWQEAVSKDQPGLLLRAARTRTGKSIKEFAGEYGSVPLWSLIETGKKIPEMTLTNRQKVLSYMLGALQQGEQELSARLGIPVVPWIPAGGPKAETLQQLFINNPDLSQKIRKSPVTIVDRVDVQGKILGPSAKLSNDASVNARHALGAAMSDLIVTGYGYELGYDDQEEEKTFLHHLRVKMQSPPSRQLTPEVLESWLDGRALMRPDEMQALLAISDSPKLDNLKSQVSDLYKTLAPAPAQNHADAVEESRDASGTAIG